MSIPKKLLLLFVVMSIPSLVAIRLCASAMLHHMGEMAFPVIVSELFWITVFVLMVEVGLLVVLGIAMKVLPKRR